MSCTNRTLCPQLICITAILFLACKPSNLFSSQETSRSKYKEQASNNLSLLDHDKTPDSSQASCGPSISSARELSDTMQAIDKGPALISPPNRPDLRIAALAALSAVPKSLLRLFFHTNQGIIIIGDEARACLTASPSEVEQALLQGQEIAVCWQAPSHNQPLRLLLKPDVTAVRGSMLRLFAYLHAEYFMERLQDTRISAEFKTPPWQKLLSGFQATREKISAAFVEDLIAEGSPQLLLMKKYRENSPIAFGNMVYANAVDSYYCNQKTREHLAASFKQVYKTITDTADPNSLVAILGY